MAENVHGGAREGAGRPTGSLPNSRTNRVVVNLTDRQMKTLRKQADRWDVTPGAALYRLISLKVLR